MNEERPLELVEACTGVSPTRRVEILNVSLVVHAHLVHLSLRVALSNRRHITLDCHHEADRSIQQVTDHGARTGHRHRARNLRAVSAAQSSHVDVDAGT